MKWWEGLEKKSKNMLTPSDTSDIVSTSSGTDSPGISPGQLIPRTKHQKGAKIMATEQTVQMENGEIKVFAGKKKLIKETSIDGNTISSKFYFLNGRVVDFEVPAEFVLRFAAHGVDQKFGDSIAGLADIDDCVLAIEDLRDQIALKGEWNARKEGSGLGGTSVLVRALMELTGKSVESIKDFLSGKSQAEKIALRNSAKLKPIVERIEAEKASKSTGVDVDTLLAEIE